MGGVGPRGRPSSLPRKCRRSMSQQTGQKKKHRKRLLFSLILIASALLLVSISIWMLLSKAHGSSSVSLNNPTPDWTSGIQIPNGAVSPLLFGTNMSLYDSSDQL